MDGDPQWLCLAQDFFFLKSPEQVAVIIFQHNLNIVENNYYKENNWFCLFGKKNKKNSQSFLSFFFFN